jgi:hypothetical protein
MTDTDDPEQTHRVTESNEKIRLQVDVTRGTGTRDQEKYKLKARGETAQEAAESLSDSLEALRERDVFSRARAVENDDTDDDPDG